MNNLIRKTLSVLIAVLMIAVLLPTASLAATQIHVFGVPGDVTGVEVYLKNGTHKDCKKPGGSDFWKGSDDGELVTGNIDYVKLSWGNHTVDLPASFWDIGEEGEPGSGTLKLTLKAGWTGSLTVTKAITGNAVPTTPAVYSFTVTGPDSYSESFTITGADSYTLTGLVPGSYTVTESVPAGSAFTVDDADQTTGVAAGQTATLTFTNTYNSTLPTTGSLMVTKAVTGNAVPTTPAVYSFTVTGPDSYSESFTITGADSYTLTGLVPGSYTVTESVPAGSAFTVDDADQTTGVAAGQTATLTFTNTYNSTLPTTGSLTVTKAVTGAAAPTTPAVYSFSVTGPDSYSESFTITGADSYTLTGLVPGSYTVTESVPAGSAFTVDDADQTTGVAAGQTATLTFTNTYNSTLPTTGSLTVTKAVTGAAAPTTPAVYSFSVTGPNSYTDSFTITGALSHTLTGLEPGSYTVTEDAPAGSAFTVDDAHQTITVAANQTAQLTFTNTYTPVNPETGTITIKKHVEGKGAPSGDEFGFSIQRVAVLDQASVMAYAPFSLKDGGQKTYDLMPGKYLITETHWPDGYEPKSASIQVTVNAGENPDVIFTNVYKHKDTPTPTYTVSYHPNGGLGTVPVDMNRYYPGDKAWLKSGAGLYRPNYVFAGWSLIDGTRVNDPYIMGRSDVTFFAIWVPVKVPKTGDQAAPYGLMMMAGAVILAALNLLGKRKHTAK